jgi:putative sigma-54 modulation protein
MKLHYSVRHLTLTRGISDYVEDKIGTLDHLDGKAIAGHVVLYHDETHGAKQYQVKVHIAVPGNDVHAEVHAKDLYEGIDLVVAKLVKQLAKHKTKARSKRKAAMKRARRVL